jgi:hypothetical protein
MKFPDVTPSSSRHTKDCGGSRSITRSSHIHTLSYPPPQDQIQIGVRRLARNILLFNRMVFLQTIFPVVLLSKSRRPSSFNRVTPN